MLRALLAHLRATAGGAAPTPAELAVALGVTPMLVDALLTELARRGHLRRLGTSPVGNCATCPLVDGCGQSGAGCTGFALVRPSSSTEVDSCGGKRG